MKLVLRLSGNLFYHVFSIITPQKLHNFYKLWSQHNFSVSRCEVLFCHSRTDSTFIIVEVLEMTR